MQQLNELNEVAKQGQHQVDQEWEQDCEVSHRVVLLAGKELQEKKVN